MSAEFQIIVYADRDVIIHGPNGLKLRHMDATSSQTEDIKRACDILNMYWDLHTRNSDK
jgi:hypothetical protein